MSRRAVARVCALALYCALGAGAAFAATSVSNASAFVSGTTVSESKPGDGSQLVVANANQVFGSQAGDAFVNAQALSRSGFLGAVGLARSTGQAGGFQAQASASWAESFTIKAGSLYSGTMGKFSGTVLVNGDMSIDNLVGRFYATTAVSGSASANGISLSNGATLRDGYDTPFVQTGSETFSLVFEQVPFVFGQPIGVSMALSVSSSLDIIDSGATGVSFAAYNETMRWGGLSEVSDAAGRLLESSEYTAIGDTGFDFARPVPEPGSAALLALGLFAICRRWLRLHV